MKKLLVSLLSLYFFYSSVPMLQAADLFSYTVGDYKVYLLSESQQNTSVNILMDASPEILKQYAPENGVPNSMSAYLLQNGDKNILVDTGIGKELFNNLNEIGVKPEEIDILLITHMHGDHIGGMIKDGKVMFPNAQVYLPQPEHDYWMNDDEMNLVAENRRGSFLQARNVINLYKDRLTTFEPLSLDNPSRELLPNIKGIAAYGHTPGHTMFLLESGDSKLMIWGDLMHAMAVQMPHPEIAVTYDVNPSLATESRLKVLDYISKENIPFAGMHIPYPGMGKVSKAKQGYSYSLLQ